MILGAVLYRGPGKGKVRWPVIVAVCVVRLLLIPLLGGLVVFGTEALNWWTPVDPLFVFVLLLQGIGELVWGVGAGNKNTPPQKLTKTRPPPPPPAPTAINMQGIATMFHFNEQEMAVLIFYQHAIYLIALPVYICACMFFIDRLPLTWAPGGALSKSVNDLGLTP